MLNFRTTHLIEFLVLLFFTVLHISYYQYFSRATITETVKPPPIFIELIHPTPKPEPKPEPKKIEPPKVIEPPKPKKVTPPKPPKPPKVVKKTPEPPKTVVKKPQRVVEKPKEQQESIVKVHAEEVVEKEVAAKPQQLSEPEVKKLEPEAKPKQEEKAAETTEVAKEAEPAHESVMTKAGYGSSCKSALNRYPAEAKEQGIEGTVKVKVQILADGSIGNASIIKSSGSDILDNSVLDHVRDCDFEPAQKDDVPITSSVVIPVRFKLDN